MACAIEQLLDYCEEHGLEWWIASERPKLRLDLQHEVRVFEDGGSRSGPTIRVRETGATPYEAAAKALAALNQTRKGEE